MPMTLSEILNAIHAREQGIWDDPCLKAVGPLLPSVKQDVIWLKRQFLEHCGYVIGLRDVRLNTNYTGAFMVLEEETLGGPSTKDGSDGPWCIVGDDLDILIDIAFDVAIDVYGGVKG